jgi:hypothetical protein
VTADPCPTASGFAASVRIRLQFKAFPLIRTSGMSP